MKKTFLLFAILFIMFSFDAQSNITKNIVTDYTIPNQGILPNTQDTGSRHTYGEVLGKNAANEGYIIIMGVTLERSKELVNPAPPAPQYPDQRQYFKGVTVDISGSLYIDSIVLTDIAGKIIGVHGFYYWGNVGEPETGRFRISTDDILIPAEKTINFFVAIRTLDFTPNGSGSTFSIGAEDVHFNPSPITTQVDVINNAVTTNRITCELLVTDLLPNQLTNHDSEIPDYPSYSQWQPSEQIRPRYDKDDYEYSYNSFNHRVPQLLPWETRTAILSIAASQRNVTANGSETPSINDPAEELKSIKLTVTAGKCGSENFNPNKTFRIGEDSTGDYHGITIWKDTNNNGRWDPEIDSRISTGSVKFIEETPTQWTLLYSIGETLEETLESPTNFADFFVVLEQRSDFGDTGYRPKMGQDYKIWIKEGDIKFDEIGKPLRYAGITEGQVKPIYNNIYMDSISQTRVDPVEMDEPSNPVSNIIPAIGINIASGPSKYGLDTTKIQRIRVELLAIENFDPRSDLAPLSIDNYSGISLWRDSTDLGVFGSFDSEDTFIPTETTNWQEEGTEYDPDLNSVVTKYSTTLILKTDISDQGLIPSYDYASSYTDGTNFENKYKHRGSDFFIAFRTTESLSYGSRFRIKIPYAGLWTTDTGKQAYNTLPVISREINGNIYAKITSLTESGNPGLIRSSGPTPLFKIELNDNNSYKFPEIEGLSVEFYDISNFNLEDLASFDSLHPSLNHITSWYDIQYFNTNALKNCGVVVYKSTPNGDIDYNSPVMIKRYRYLSWPGAPNGFQFEFLEPISIPTTLYVVIRTSDTFTPGDSFDAGIVGWGVDETDWDTWGSRAIAIIDANGIKSTPYVKRQSGAFNPPNIGVIYLLSENTYDYIRLDWVNSTHISDDTFKRYEVIRNGVVIATITDINQTWYVDRRDGQNPPVEGVSYDYRVNMFFSQGGAITTFSSNEVVGNKLLGFIDSQRPTDFRLAPGTETMNIQWTDRSYSPGNSDTFYNRADSFRLKRIYLNDGTFAESIIVSQWTANNPNNIFYEINESGPLPGGPYRYELYLRKNINGGVVESRPVSREASIYPEGQPSSPPGSGGCFIATAVYGTDMAKEVISLKRFRDQRLLTNRIGRAFVRWYYRHSPPVANYIRDKGSLKTIVRVGLQPLLWFANRF